MTFVAWAWQLSNTRSVVLVSRCLIAPVVEQGDCPWSDSSSNQHSLSDLCFIAWISDGYYKLHVHFQLWLAIPLLSTWSLNLERNGVMHNVGTCKHHLLCRPHVAGWPHYLTPDKKNWNKSYVRMWLQNHHLNNIQHIHQHNQFSLFNGWLRLYIYIYMWLLPEAQFASHSHTYILMAVSCSARLHSLWWGLAKKKKKHKKSTSACQVATLW